MSVQLIFKNRAAFRQWLRKNHAQPEGLWLVFGKNNMLKTLNPEQALEEALCFGWIDGLIKRVDETKYIKFFSPRRTKSHWSERNKGLAEELIQSGKMASPGRKAIENAKKNGTWESPERPVISQEEIERFVQAIASSSQAVVNFQNMPYSVKRQCTGFYLDAKREDARQRRLEKLIGLLEQNKRPM
jgi:uncharacterized protein YdeI (YjbR/CyaY-like superfamily)